MNKIQNMQFRIDRITYHRKSVNVYNVSVGLREERKELRKMRRDLERAKKNLQRERRREVRDLVEEPEHQEQHLNTLLQTVSNNRNIRKISVMQGTETCTPLAEMDQTARVETSLMEPSGSTGGALLQVNSRSGATSPGGFGATLEPINNSARRISVSTNGVTVEIDDERKGGDHHREKLDNTVSSGGNTVTVDKVLET